MPFTATSSYFYFWQQSYNKKSVIPPGNTEQKNVKKLQDNCDVKKLDRQPNCKPLLTQVPLLAYIWGDARVTNMYDSALTRDLKLLY